MLTLTSIKAAVEPSEGGVWFKVLVPYSEAQQARQFVLRQKDKPYSVEVKEKREKRSLDANAYFHVLVGKISEATNVAFEEVKTWLVTDYGTFERDDSGLKVGFKLPASVDVSKIYRYVKCFDTRSENGVDFNCYIVFKQTHLMNGKEMSRLIDGAVTEAKSLGLEVLPPEKLTAMKEDWNAQRNKGNGNHARD